MYVLQCLESTCSQFNKNKFLSPALNDHQRGLVAEYRDIITQIGELEQQAADQAKARNLSRTGRSKSMAAINLKSSERSKDVYNVSQSSPVRPGTCAAASTSQVPLPALPTGHRTPQPFPLSLPNSSQSSSSTQSSADSDSIFHIMSYIEVRNICCHSEDH